MLLNNLFQRGFNFCDPIQVEGPSQIALLVGEFYEQLAIAYWGGNRIFSTSSFYRDILHVNEVEISDNGIIEHPDIYIEKDEREGLEKVLLEVKASQRGSSFKLRLSQMCAFRKLLMIGKGFNHFHFVFFSYDAEDLANKIESLDELLHILSTSTTLMARIDFAVIGRLLTLAEQKTPCYGSSGDYKHWSGGPLFMLRPGFLDDLVWKTELFCKNLRVSPEHLRLKRFTVDNFSFLGRTMNFSAVTAYLGDAS